MQKTIILAAGGVVLNDKNELLMIFRRGKWDLPKGKLDEGESIEDCAVREVSEETGLQSLQLGKPVAITRHEYFDPYRKEDVIKESHWFTMRATGNQPLVPQTEEDITDIRWIPGDALGPCLNNTYPTIIEVLQKAELISR